MLHLELTVKVEHWSVLHFGMLYHFQLISDTFLKCFVHSSHFWKSLAFVLKGTTTQVEHAMVVNFELAVKVE
jgi:hypothetical protein